MIASIVASASGSATLATAAHSWTSWTGTAVRANDGDTLLIDVDGDGHDAIKVRLIGVNAFEVGECMAEVATDTLDELVGDRDVVLTVPTDVPIDKYGRRHAYVSVDGVDLGGALIDRGTVWPVPKDWSVEDTDIDYFRRAEAARATEAGIWQPDACGSPPAPNAEFEMRILRNPDGRDEDDPNKEWVKIINTGDGGVDLAGWQVRSSGEEKYTFPPGTSLGRGAYVKIHAGTGTNRPEHLFWGFDRPLFSNNHPESVVLIDPSGNLREIAVGPCLYDCGDPLKGKIKLRVNYDAPGADGSNPNGEWIEIVNVSSERVDLVDYMLINDQHRFIPAGGARLDPGERMRVHVGEGTPTRLEKYWGKPKGILANRGDDVVLRNIDGVKIAAISWPCTSCGDALPDLDIVFVNPDAPGSDDAHLDQEFVLIRNDSGSSVDLTDWALRSGSHWYRFDAGLVFPAGAVIRLQGGIGPDDMDGARWTLHWGRTSSTLRNESGVVSIFGPDLGEADCFGWGGARCEPNLRPLKMSTTVRPDPPGSDEINANDETVRLKNKESHPVDYSGFMIVHRGAVFTVAEGTVIGPEQGVTVHAGHGASRKHHQYWGTSGKLLANGGGVVEVYDRDGYLVERERYS